MSIFHGRSFLRNDESEMRDRPGRPQPVRLAAAVAGLVLCVAAGTALAQEAGEAAPVIAPVEQAAPPPAQPAASEPAEPAASVPAEPAAPAASDDAAQPPVAEEPQETEPAAQAPAAQAPAAQAPAAQAPAEQTPAEQQVAPALTQDEAAPETEEPPLLLEEAEPAGEAEAVSGRDPSLPHDLSPWGMFMMADWVVKAVMISLVFASVVTWTVWVAKSMEIAGARARASRALGVITRSRRLEDAAGQLRRRKGPGALLVRAAEEEVRLSAEALDYAGSDGLKDRVAMRLSRIQAQAGRRLGRGTGLLATIGATAPFVGLFGTVWGIMNSFIGISEAQTTNLAVVAPGIAEALLATALGLVAAIPAVVFYNVFARAITGYRQMLADAAAGVELLVSRDLDYRRVPATEPAVAEGASALAIAATRS